MDLSPLTSLVGDTPEVGRLLRELSGRPDRHRVTLIEAAKPCFLAALHRGLKAPVLVIASSVDRAEELQDQVPHWCREGVSALAFPEPDCLPYEELVSDSSVLQQRLRVIHALAECRSGSGPAPLILSSATAVARKTMSSAGFSSASHTISLGERMSPIDLLKRWVEMGYEIETTVEVPGTASHRGGIVDVYSPSSAYPVRIEFFGDEVESLRTFDPQSQVSLASVPSATIIPARPVADALLGTLLEFLPEGAVVVLDDLTAIEAAVEELDREATELRQERVDQGDGAEETPRPYVLWAELEAKLGQGASLVLPRWSVDGADDLIWESFVAAPTYAGRLDDFLPDLREMMEDGHRIVITSLQVHRLSELLREDGIVVEPADGLDGVPAQGSVSLVQGSLSEGWRRGDTVVLTDTEIFGFAKQRRRVRRHPARRRVFIPDLAVGDYAVHVDHGIGRFGGIFKKDTDGVEREYLMLRYADGGTLFVPMDQADRVTRHIGSGGDPPPISKLGTQEWARVKKRVKERAQDMAEELLSLYAAREVVPGMAYPPDTPWQQELEASFPYVETPDQAEALERVKEDMQRPKPMDRLVCGDVGYGKTEVALRAAFKAVMNGKQVAILVPTTVLAQQHFVTFSDRLRAFPVTVEMLSRFRSEKEQRTVIEGLSKGKVDICIGTHRLLQKDVAFKDLGLVIIDEEQRFGVSHKERLKQMRREVDVLTLSATPVPRTLHMALVGVRDMSTMETPPEERLPIKTFVGPHSEKVVREAILREMERSGQVFFVHNRVENISRIAHRLEELVPEAVIDMAHGQMSEDRLERAMLDFTQGRADVLVCSTIIQSGLDIPNVNTLIVNDADRLGLTQLYQLRGRVGRGSHRAYAYFLFPKGKQLTSVAERRLETILEATELGSGFHIAMKDLEIRGAGNVLGTEQSGHIAAVGFDLYCELLSEAVEELKAKTRGEPVLPRPSVSVPSVDLPLDAYLPGDYVADDSLRLSLYQRLARLKTLEEVEEISKEFKDRFGEHPRVVKNLLYMMKIRALAAQAGVESVYAQNQQVVVCLGETARVDPGKLAWARGEGLTLGTNQLRLDTKRQGKRWAGVLKRLLINLS
jgi:transcription-repair coupling factor (superfamily II helicase)